MVPATKASSSLFGLSLLVLYMVSYSTLKTSAVKVSKYIHSSGSSFEGFQYSLKGVMWNFSAAGSEKDRLMTSKRSSISDSFNGKSWCVLFRLENKTITWYRY